jgi:hypothetical protein
VDPVLAELQARQAVQRFHQLSGQVQHFTAQAKLLRGAKSFAFDPRLLLSEADKLLKSLMASRSDFDKYKALTTSLSRSLSSRPPATGGMSPAQKWRPEFKAGAKQFTDAVRDAEKALELLYKEAHAEINLPTRTSSPEMAWHDALLALCQLLVSVVEYCKRQKK